MLFTAVPGYKHLFGISPKNYEEYVANIPSEVVITFAIMYNNELHEKIKSEHEMKQLQARLMNSALAGLSAEQHDAFRKAHDNHVRRFHSDGLFGRAFLNKMIVRELNNYRHFSYDIPDKNEGYNLLMAYLLVVDEVLADIWPNDGKPYNLELDRVWVDYIKQAELSDYGHPPIELFKLICWVNYVKDKYPTYWEEYLAYLNLKSVGHFFWMYQQIAGIAASIDEYKEFKHLNTFVPFGGDLHHPYYKDMTINHIIGTVEVTSAVLKRYPLFLDSRGKYWISDVSYLLKKIYKGPFFDLANKTSMPNDRRGTYISDIASEVLEKKCFATLMEHLNKKSGLFMHFDNRTESVPDGYVREGKKIMLFEYKAYLFPDEIALDPDPMRIKKYIDERFIRNERGKAKGITQLITQIEKIYKKEFNFDPFLNKQKNIVIYPVLVHNEVNLDMLGLNEYLNTAFMNGLSADVKKAVEVKPLVVLSIESLFDLILYGYNLHDLRELFDRYNQIILNRKRKIAGIDGSNMTPSKFQEFKVLVYKSKATFGNICRQIFLQEKSKHPPLSFTDYIKVLGVSDWSEMFQQIADQADTEKALGHAT